MMLDKLKRMKILDIMNFVYFFYLFVLFSFFVCVLYIVYIHMREASVQCTVYMLKSCSTCAVQLLLSTYMVLFSYYNIRLCSTKRERSISSKLCCKFGKLREKIRVKLFFVSEIYYIYIYVCDSSIYICCRISGENRGSGHNSQTVAAFLYAKLCLQTPT